MKTSGQRSPGGECLSHLAEGRTAEPRRGWHRLTGHPVRPPGRSVHNLPRFFTESGWVGLHVRQHGSAYPSPLPGSGKSGVGNDPASDPFYVLPPDIPVGLTIPDYRRNRA